MWVQVPPLALPAGSFAIAPRLWAAVLAATLCGCSTFGRVVNVGPVGGVVARAIGPASSLAATDERALLGFAARADPHDRDLAWVARLPQTGEATTKAEPIAAGGSAGRAATPVVLAGPEDLFVVAWRARTASGESRLWWTGVTGERFDPPRDLGTDLAADPRGGGDPSTLIAAVGRPPRPGDSLAVPLAVWQLDSTNGAWDRIEAGSGQPLGYQALGVRGLGGPLAAILDERGELRLASLSSNQRDEGTTIRFAARPAGPRPVWLGRIGETLIAAWSEYRAGTAGYGAVRFTRSLDAARSWSPPQAIFEAGVAWHPMAGFASDGSTLAAVWRARGADGPRIVLAVSRDGGATFASTVDVDGGEAVQERTAPAVAVRDKTILVTWQERSANGETSIRASLSRDGGASFTPRGERLDEKGEAVVVGNPQPWLLAEGGGVVWESKAPAPDAARSLGRFADPARLSLHARTVER